MDVVVTEELRGAGSHGREMIETEEAVDLAESVEVQLNLNENAQEKQAVRFDPQFVMPPELVPLGSMATETARREGGWLGTFECEHSNALAEALTDPNVSPGAHMAAILNHHREEAIRRRNAIAASVRGTVTYGMPKQRTVLTAQQPDAVSFLSRDYHLAGANRFLFSCADEYDGYATNKGSGWNYSLPESER